MLVYICGMLAMWPPLQLTTLLLRGMVGWCDGARLTSSAGASYFIWIREGQGPTALAVGAGGGCWKFLLSSIISLFFLPLFGSRPDIDRNIVSKGR